MQKENVGTDYLAGTWQLVSDSTSLAGAGQFKGGGQTYYGTTADQYIFTTDGQLYVKEGSNIDTAKYTVANNKLTLNYTYLLQSGTTIRGAMGSFDISNQTEHSLTLTSDGITPEGNAVQIINLKK